MLATTVVSPFRGDSKISPPVLGGDYEKDPDKSCDIGGDTDLSESMHTTSPEVSSDPDADNEVSDGAASSSGVKSGILEGAPPAEDAIGKKAMPKSVAGEPYVYFEADALGRQCKTDLFTGKRICKFGRKAQSRLASNFPKPLVFDNYSWRKEQAKWKRADDQGKKRIDEELLALACIQVDLKVDGDGRKRYRDVLHAPADSLTEVNRIQFRSDGPIARRILKYLRSTPSKSHGCRTAQVEVPDGPYAARADITKKISDFNFSCREFATETDLVHEARAQIIEEA